MTACSTFSNGLDVACNLALARLTAHSSPEATEQGGRGPSPRGARRWAGLISMG
jgi:hypothetical protein